MGQMLITQTHRAEIEEKYEYVTIGGGWGGVKK